MFCGVERQWGEQAVLTGKKQGRRYEQEGRLAPAATGQRRCQEKLVDVCGLVGGLQILA